MARLSLSFLRFVFLICSTFSFAQNSRNSIPASRVSHDWLTWGNGVDRTSWSKAETVLTKDNVSKLELKWTAQLDNPVGAVELSTLTSPLVVENVETRLGRKTLVYVVGSADIVYSIDAATGKVFWQRRFPNDIPPKFEATWLCPNSQNATPVIDRATGVIYVLTSDGMLRGLSITNGEDKMPPASFVTPNSRNWSLSLVDGVIYTTVARGCGGAAAEIAAMDIKDPTHPTKKKFNTSVGRPNGAWGRGALTLGPRGMYAMTADGPFDPAANLFGETFLILDPRTLELVDYYTPSNWEYLNAKDLDLGSSTPLVFPFRNWDLVAGIAKEGVMYLLDSKSIGGADHHTPLYVSPRYGNDEVLFYSRGVWGAMATWEDSEHERWLYVPMWGPPVNPLPEFKYIHGMQESGSIMALRVVLENDKPALAPVWISESMSVPDPPVVANGVVYAVSTGENNRQRSTGSNPEDRFSMVGNASLRAFDALTGELLYHSGSLVRDWTHFSSLAIADGRIYFTTHHSQVHSFGLPDGGRAPARRTP